MATIVRSNLGEPSSAPRQAPFDWSPVAEKVRDWADSANVELRDAVVLLPFAQLLGPARRAWAKLGGWMPRIETTQTLAASCAPRSAPAPGRISFDAATDRLLAARRLRDEPWLQARRRRDPALAEQAVAMMVEAAHAFARASAQFAPQQRAGYWQQGRSLLPSASPTPSLWDADEGPGGAERLLARAALEWAATSAAPATDALFDLRPAAWIAIQVGGPDRLTASLLAKAQVPQLLIDLDVPLQSPFDAADADAIELAVCEDFEDEAQRTAARVLMHLQRRETPVALIAQDRSVVRRVRALLERQRVPMQDETGWRLSTTRAAAQLMSLLRTLAPRAATDDLLDWLKSCDVAGAALPERRVATPALERLLRRHGWARLAAVDATLLQGAESLLWHQVQALRDDFAAPRSRRLADWRNALRGVLEASGDGAFFADDEAGVPVLEALRLARAADSASWIDAAMQAQLDFEQFVQWVDATLEQSTFVPDAGVDALVVITPLARAMLRPFAALVMPGADERHLGGGGSDIPLIDDALAEAMGLNGRRARRDAEILAFAQALAMPRVTLLRRRRDDVEPLAPSLLLEGLALALRRAGASLRSAEDDRDSVVAPAHPTPMPLPVAPGLLPQRLSASAVETLRACPYRFHALYLLGLREQNELEEGVDARDYGNWLHAVLHRFHTARSDARDADADAAELHAAAAAESASLGLDAAEFLPYAATFEDFVPRYVRWLHRREAGGARWHSGEVELDVASAALPGIELFGRIDRIDGVHDRSGPPALELIDYKTGSVEDLKRNLRQPTEDTQLAFYAALMMHRDESAKPALAASYVALQAGDGIVSIPHPEVETTARLLVAELADEMQRLRDGAPMPALGEGKVCEYCTARGLCRRDDWSVQ